jgi:phenylacetate-CoA ligase
MHFVSPDHCILELVDPATHEPRAMTEGAVGEMVFTFIGWEGGPFMRYALGDLIQIYTEPCICGWPEMRFKILGRADDMLIIKGVNIYPAALKSVVGELIPRTTGAFRIMLDKQGPLVTPPLKIKVEFGDADMTEDDKHSLVKELTHNMRDRLRVKPQIELVPPQSLPRVAGKTSLIEIKRKVESS